MSQQIYAKIRLKPGSGKSVILLQPENEPGPEKHISVGHCSLVLVSFATLLPTRTMDLLRQMDTGITPDFEANKHPNRGAAKMASVTCFHWAQKDRPTW